MSSSSASISHHVDTSEVRGIDGGEDRDLCRVQIRTYASNYETEEFVSVQSDIWGTPEELFAFARAVDRAVAELVVGPEDPHCADCSMPGVRVETVTNMRVWHHEDPAVEDEHDFRPHDGRDTVIHDPEVVPLDGAAFHPEVVEEAALVILCGECGESVVPGEDEIVTGEQGEDCHARCVDGATAVIEGW